jgi:membrane fusion protein (multidrug efflux system)
MSTTGKNRARSLVLTVIVVVAIAVVFGLRFHQLGQDTALASIRSVQDEKGIPVETVTAKRAEMSQWITLAGTVEGTIQYPVVSNNALQVMAVAVKEGDRVQKGDVIIRLSTGAPSPMYHSLPRARASFENAKVDVQRLRNLYEAGAVSLSELDAAETQLKVLATDLQDAEGSSALTATEPGVVSSILVTEGQMVKAGNPLVWITDTAEVIVKFSAGSNQALRLDEGLEAVWTSPEGKVRKGVITKLDLMADPTTHLLAGEARFDNSDGRLVPGLLVSFQVRTSQKVGALTVPTGCVMTHLDQKAVWVVEETAHRVNVELGLSTVDEVEILSGLEEGQQVVLHGQTLLREGVLVKDVTPNSDLRAGKDS